MVIADMIDIWTKWLRNNPDADVSLRYYAAGVVDGLVYAQDPETFKPRWRDLLKTDDDETFHCP